LVRPATWIELKINGTSAVWNILPSSNKLTKNSLGFSRTTPLISIVLFGKNPFPNPIFTRSIVVGNVLKIKKII